MKIFLIFGALVALTIAYPLSAPNTDPEAQKIAEEFVYTCFKYFLEGDLSFLDSEFYVMNNEGQKITKDQIETVFGPYLKKVREEYKKNGEFREGIDKIVYGKREGDWRNCVIQFINDRFIEVKLNKDNQLVGYIILKPSSIIVGGYKMYRLIMV